MSEHYLDRGEHPSLPESFYETFGTLRPVQRSFSLLSDVETFGSDVKEWTTTKTPERIITFKGGSKIEETHDYLVANGVHLLQKKSLGEDRVLPVPEGARSMRTIAGFIERDPQNYSIVFRLLGGELRAIHESNVGLPSGNWLDQFAYHPDAGEKYGAKVVLLPPYNTHERAVNAMTEIGLQLADTTNLNETTITQLAWEVHDGWNRET